MFIKEIGDHLTYKFITDINFIKYKFQKLII